MKVHVCFSEYVIRVLQYHLRTYDITYAVLQAMQKLQDFVLTSIYTFERASLKNNVVRAEPTDELAVITGVVCL